MLDIPLIDLCHSYFPLCLQFFHTAISCWSSLLFAEIQRHSYLVFPCKSTILLASLGICSILDKNCTKTLSCQKTHLSQLFADIQSLSSLPGPLGLKIVDQQSPCHQGRSLDCKSKSEPNNNDHSLQDQEQ